MKSEPGSTLAWYNLGVIAQQARDDASATHDFEAAIGTNEAYVPALYNLAILVTSADPRRAELLYQRCIAAQPGDADAYLNIGFVERTLGHAALGRADIDKAVALDPSLGASSRKG